MSQSLLSVNSHFGHISDGSRIGHFSDRFGDGHFGYLGGGDGSFGNFGDGGLGTICDGVFICFGYGV